MVSFSFTDCTRSGWSDFGNSDRVLGAPNASRDAERLRPPIAAVRRVELEQEERQGVVHYRLVVERERAVHVAGDDDARIGWIHDDASRLVVLHSAEALGPDAAQIE